MGMRATSILENPSAVVGLCKLSGNMQHVVFTCMYSKLRAPRCATALTKQLQRAPAEDSSLVVLILQGGIHGWVNHWHKTGSVANLEKYVAEFDPAVWQDGAGVG